MDSTPVWMEKIIVEMIHHGQLKEHGGLFGILDENALDAALARPQQKDHYENQDLAALAAAYAFGLATSHAFNDGNKRTAYVTAAIFAQLNGWDLYLTAEDIEQTMIRVATQACDEAQLAAIFRAGMTPLPSEDAEKTG